MILKPLLGPQKTGARSPLENVNLSSTRRIFREIEDGTVGKFVINTSFVKMSESPPRVKWVSCDIGKDNDYIRKRYLQRR